jgi:hypothetical protein
LAIITGAVALSGFGECLSPLCNAPTTLSSAVADVVNHLPAKAKHMPALVSFAQCQSALGAALVERATSPAHHIAASKVSVLFVSHDNQLLSQSTWRSPWPR